LVTFYKFGYSLFRKAQLLELFERELAKVMTIDLEAIAKFREMKNLKTQMQARAVKKLQLEG